MWSCDSCWWFNWFSAKCSQLYCIVSNHGILARKRWWFVCHWLFTDASWCCAVLLQTFRNTLQGKLVFKTECGTHVCICMLETEASNRRMVWNLCNSMCELIWAYFGMQIFFLFNDLPKKCAHCVVLTSVVHERLCLLLVPCPLDTHYDNVYCEYHESFPLLYNYVMHS